MIGNTSRHLNRWRPIRRQAVEVFCLSKQLRRRTNPGPGFARGWESASVANGHKEKLLSYYAS